MRDSAIRLDILDGVCAGYCERVRPSPSVVEDSKAIGWPLMVGAEVIMECTLRAKDIDDGCSSPLIEVESETPSGGAIRFVSIEGAASSSFVVEDADIHKVGRGLACPQNRGKGVDDVIFSPPFQSLAWVCSLSTGESDRSGRGSASRSGGIAECLVPCMGKDLERCCSPTKHGFGVGVGWE